MAKLPDPYSAARPVPRFGGVDQANPVVVGGDVAVGQAISNVGSQVMRFALREQAKADQAMLDSKTTEYKRRLLDLQREAYAVKGKDVAENDRYMPDFEDRHALLVQEVLSETKNPRVHELLQGRLELGEVNFKEGLINHITRETEVFAAETLDNANAIDVDMMAADPYDDAQIDQLSDAIQVRIARYGQQRGWSPERIENATRETLTKGHTEVISNMLDDGNVLEAETYFKRYSEAGEIEGEAYDQIKSAIKSAGKVVRAQDLSDTAYAQFQNDKAAGLDWIRENARPEDRQEALRLLKSRYDEDKTLKAEQVKQHTESAWQIANNALDQNVRPTQAYAMIPNTILEGMDQNSRASLRRYLEARAAGTTIKTNPQVYFDTLRQIRQNPDEWKNKDLSVLAGDISFTDLKALDAERNKDAKLLGSEDQRIAMGLAAVGLEKKDLTGDPDDKDTVKARLFYKFVQDRLPRDYSEEDLEKAVNDAALLIRSDERKGWAKMIDAVLPGDWDFGYDEKYGFEMALTPGSADLAREVEAAGYTITEENMLDAEALRAMGLPVNAQTMADFKANMRPVVQEETQAEPVERQERRRGIGARQ